MKSGLTWSRMRCISQRVLANLNQILLFLLPLQWTGQSSYEQVAHTQLYPCFAVRWIRLKIAPCQAAIFAKPPKGALHNPSAGQYLKAFLVRRFFHHFHPQSGGRGGRFHGRAAVAPVAPKQLEFRSPPFRFCDDRRGPDRVLHGGRLHLNGQQ